MTHCNYFFVHNVTMIYLLQIEKKKKKLRTIGSEEIASIYAHVGMCLNSIFEAFTRI